MMALNHSRISGARLDDIGIDGPLCKIIYRSNLLSFRLKHPDKFFSDNFAFRLRLANSGKLVQKSLLRIHSDKVNIPILKCRNHFVAFIFPH